MLQGVVTNRDQASDGIFELNDKVW